MNNTKEYKGTFGLDLIEKFPSGFPHKSFSAFIFNLVDVESAVSVAGIMFPELVEMDGHFFLKETCEAIGDDKILRHSTYGTDRKTLERYRNLYAFDDIFWLLYEKGSDIELLMLQFAKTLVYAWEMHFKRMLPHITFEFEIAPNGLFDEDCICITFSQV